VGDSAPLDWELRAQKRARRHLAWQRNRKRFLIIGAALVTIGFAGGAVWAWQSDSVGDRREPTAVKRAAVPPTIGTRVRLSCRAPLNSSDPLRLWIAGDSLAGSLGPELGELTADTGVVAPTFDTRPSSGLASPEFFNWPEHAREEIARIDPEVVVFIIGANDSGVAADGYRALVDEMLNILGDDGRSVIWIGSPTLRDDRKNDGVRQLNQVAEEVAGLHARTTYVDAYTLFGDKRGDYTATVPGVDGRPVRVRTSDGVHFTPAGGRYLASHVVDILEQRCDIRGQADPGHPQQVRESPGSGGPTGDEQTNGGGNGGNSGTTPPTPPPTPPPTAPPTTSPPSTLLSLPI
jgi:uncharacterized protein